MAVSERGTIRFGPFELDLQCGELRRDGAHLKLQGQPIQILELLLTKHGELVSREEIRQRLWSGDTFVDFEHSLNTAIKKLRQALGDDAETPQYIETIPKRGYRYVGKIIAVDSLANHPQPQVSVGVAVSAVVPSQVTAVAPLSDGKASSRRGVFIVRAVVVCVLALASFYWMSRPPAVPHIVGSHALTKTGFRKGFGVLTDGTSIYFQENRPNNSVLMQVRLRGGEVSEIGRLSDMSFTTDISKDGSELLLNILNTTTNKFDAWVQPLPGGPARLVVKDAWAPTWTPDGQGILFARSHNRELFRANADGTDPRRIATLPDIAGIRVSPDGLRVRVSTNFIGANLGLLQVDSMGSSAPRPFLTDVRGDLLMGPWTADGRFFFFLGWISDRSDLWVLPEKRHWWQRGEARPVQLTFGPLSIGPPAISKDGKQIYAAALERHGELSVYDYRSGQFVPYLSGISACYTDFSRDGEWIAYVSHPEGTLWRSRVNGNERRQLTSPPLGVMNPRWSPDGKLIVFVNVAATARHSEQKKWQIYVVSADGGGPLLLLEGDGFNDPTWSPDGNSLAYGVGPIGSASLKILDLQTRRSMDVPGSENLSSARWSPDGNHLVALTLDYPAQKLMIYSFQSQKWEELALGAFAWPSWSHDGRYIYAMEGNSIVRIAITGHKKEKVASLQGLRTTAYYFDRIGLGWVGLTPNDRPITTRDLGIEEIYAFDLEYK